MTIFIALKDAYNILIHQEREDPEFALDMKKAEAEFDKRKVKMQIYFEQVKNAEKVKIDMIPLPEAPSLDTNRRDFVGRKFKSDNFGQAPMSARLEKSKFCLNKLDSTFFKYQE
ncbi:hypothetical protein HELRODRAFT_184617 [Helobdella robusta]|uniref:Uncharacterized protein n=1 Tax=Helobdella robusta TaxID=6412 RepID=T1FLL3_HELRO|nr:hypothetical protein HELRODRAFT_184617 [Helobdella robusta]ESO08699.1 hypothetical protein HELRODRAFT_184617 [Helobdella robusta]